MNATLITAERLPAPGSRWLALLRRLFALCAMTGAALLAGVAIGSSQGTLLLLAAVLAAVFVLMLLFRYRSLTPYLLVGAVTLFDAFSLRFPDSLTDRVPLFQNLVSLGAAIPLPLSPVELLMGTGLALLVLRRMAERRSPFETGPIFPALLAYTGLALFGVVSGIGQGGNLTSALWEARVQFYPLAVYLLAYNLVRTREGARRLMWVFLAGVAFKGLLGVFRFAVTLGGDLSRITEVSRSNSLMAHEESYFFALFITLAAALVLFRADRRQLRFALLTVAPVLLSLMANQRRAGMLVAILGLAVVAVLAFVALPRVRKPIAVLAIVGLFVLPPYVLAFGHSGGIIAQPARTIVSAYAPSARDAGSDEYRTLETENVKRNIAQSPVLGLGYGRPMEMFVKLPDISRLFSLWDVIPHNTVLWVWMRLGVVGFVAMWFLVGRSIVASVHTVRQMTDPYARVIGVLSVTAVFGWVVLGAVDMGFTDPRVTVFTWSLVALAARRSRTSHTLGDSRTLAEARR